MAGLNRVVLVSGAASGFGLVTVRELVSAGWTVYAGFRPNGRTAPEPSRGNAIHWLPLDVTDSAARSAAVATIEREQGRLDALVNSAGVNASGPLEEVPDSVLRQVMEVNFFGSIGLTRDCLPLMRTTGGGTVVMLSSLSALIGLPFNGAYAASKYALEGATESLRYEVEAFGIRVTLIQPGAYATSLADVNASASAGPSCYEAYQKLRAARAGVDRGGGVEGARISVSSGGGARGPGGDPLEVARKIVDTLSLESPGLRVPCGAQAERVIAELRTHDSAQRREFALRVAGIPTTPP